MTRPKSATNARPSRLQLALAGGAALGLALVAYGLIRVPGAAATNLQGVLGIAVMLAIYGVLGWLGPAWLRRRDPLVLRAAVAAGLLAGLIFAGEMVLEYVLLPTDNSLMGTVEYGLVIGVLLLTALGVAYRTRGVRNGLFAAIAAAMIASLIWYNALLVVFYLFRGSPQQAQVFLAEGNMEDFARSGMANFDAWIMGDFLGAGFFHMLLLPTLAAILGLICGTLGKGLARLRHRGDSLG